MSFTLGPLTFHLYGLILGIAMIVGWNLTEHLAKRIHLPSPLINRAALAGITFGLFGARLYHVIDLWWYYREHLPEIFYLWNGGLGIWGAVIGGVLGLYFIVPKTSFFSILDIVSISLPLSQAIGRWGNFVNHELFGQPTHLPWKLFIPLEFRPHGYESVAYYHPLFLYESLLNTILFLLMYFIFLRRFPVGSGKFFGLYLIGYGIIRFILEPLRLTVWSIAGFPTAQIISLIMMIVGIVFLFRKKFHET